MSDTNETNSPYLKADHLVKTYGTIKAVQDVSFSVNRGDVIAFLGPNGAGKSTTIKMMAGFLIPTSGQILFQGQPITDNLLRNKRLIGYMPESSPSYGEMTTTEYLEFIAESYEIENIPEAIEKVIQLTKLEKVRNQLIETLSKGYRSRVSFAAAIIHDPPVLLLDEPTDGLDPNQKNEIRTLIKKLSSNKAVVISTHILEEVGAMCNRVVVISEGKKVLDGTTTDLEAKAEQKEQVIISIKRDKKEQYESALAANLSRAEVGANGDDKFYVESSIEPQEVVQRINNAKLEIKEVYLQKPNIDLAFRKITKTTE